MTNDTHPEEEEEESGDTKGEIMWATYRAVKTHGYAELSISKIANEAGISKSALYNHYSGKDELLVSFSKFISDKYEKEIEPSGNENPADQLKVFQRILSDQFLNGEQSDGSVDTDLVETIIELKAQAIHTKIFKDHFSEREQQQHERLVDIIRRGIEEGHFQDVDPVATAQFLQTILYGTLYRNATTSEETVPLEAISQELDEYLQYRLLE